MYIYTWHVTHVTYVTHGTWQNKWCIPEKSIKMWLSGVNLWSVGHFSQKLCWAKMILAIFQCVKNNANTHSNNENISRFRLFSTTSKCAWITQWSIPVFPLFGRLTGESTKFLGATVFKQTLNYLLHRYDLFFLHWRREQCFEDYVEIYNINNDQVYHKHKINYHHLHCHLYDHWSSSASIFWCRSIVGMIIMKWSSWSSWLSWSWRQRLQTKQLLGRYCDKSSPGPVVSPRGTMVPLSLSSSWIIAMMPRYWTVWLSRRP